MAMQWSALCLVAVSVLGCLCDAQWTGYSPQKPETPPNQPSLPAHPYPYGQKPALPIPVRPGYPHKKPDAYQPPKPIYRSPQKPDYKPPRKPEVPYPLKPAYLPLKKHPSQQKPANPDPKRPYPVIKNPVQNSELSCEVDDHYKISCGLPDITSERCHAISCCYAGNKCFYGKAVTVQCTKDGQFVVVVARDATLPSLDLESIHLLESGGAHCTPVGTTSAFAIYQFKVTECGTTVTQEEEHDTITYSNRMTSAYEVGLGPYGAITRDSQYDLVFQCRYTGSAIETLTLSVSPPLNPIPVIFEAPINVELRLASGHCLMKGCNEEQDAYTSYYTAIDYPVTKVLRDPVYAEVRILGMRDPHIVLMLEQCWATTTPQSTSLPRWDLLVNGCSYHDDRYLTNPIPMDRSSPLATGEIANHYKRFVFKMFTFVDPTSMAPMRENVYIHCSTTICHSDAGHCEQTCNRQRRDVSSEGQRETNQDVLVSSHQVIMVNQPASA
ncbi:hypothetical protein UPYG_G00266190 [Umbra pygmaea]|uniref:Zona pellucida sperm-binding protein 4 n=1 Tax=Umbra pygmaea TaxID=75934 RepID=A0ABD0WA87_UMBPY